MSKCAIVSSAPESAACTPGGIYRERQITPLGGSTVEDLEQGLLVEFKQLWDELIRLTEGSPGFFRLRGYQSRAALETTLVKRVQQLHRSSWRSYKIKTGKSGASGDLWDAPMHVSQTRLPLKIAREIAGRAIQTQAISKRRLIYGLLAHYEHKTVDQIRGIIERAEADYPDLLEQL